MSTTKTWYIRKQPGKAIAGPFPDGQISQGILLGRYTLEHEVSHDKEEWLIIREVKELVPDVFAENQDAPGFDDRLAAARRWADERRGIADSDVEAERRTDESYESKEIKRLHRLASKGKKQSTPLMTFVILSIVLLVIIGVIVLAFQYSPKDKNVADCSASAKQGVNWSGCNLSGAQLLNVKLIAANLMNANLQTVNLNSADLSLANLQYTQLHLANLQHVNFSKANLKGANLTGADLSGASFEQANLSYANFRDAIIRETNFSNARLDNAIWVDGRKCSASSIGSCN